MTADAPRLSIGVPVFNSERFLPAALESLLRQTFRDTEVILCDNASTDSTPEICRRFERDDSRVRYHLNDRNLGVTANYNRVARLARGEYFKWASANDTCHPAYLEECVRVLDRSPEVVLCYGRTRFVYDDGREVLYEKDFAAMEERPAERWVKVMERLGFNNALNGVMRRETLMRTLLLGPYIASDLTTIAELSLYGRFELLPDCRFYRAMQAGAASARMKPAEVFAHYEPLGVGKPQLRTWRALYELGWGAARAPIPLLDKLVIARHLMRWTWSNTPALVRELSNALKSFGTPSLRRPAED